MRCSGLGNGGGPRRTPARYATARPQDLTRPTAACACPALGKHGSLNFQQAAVARGRGEEGRAGSRSPAPARRRLRFDGHSTTEAEAALQKLEAAYSGVLAKLEALRGATN